MRRCVLHVGTHKTATTSLQHFLDSRPRQLAASGYLYPRVGRPEGAPAGHHNLAWQISGDRRFLTDYGTEDDLLREIAETNLNIIISSEDFECSAHHHERFEKFIAALRRLAIRVSLIVYLRNQIDYAESLYCTQIHQGFDQPFSTFCDEILELGAARWREWIFPFDYESFIDNLAANADVDVIVRSYDHPMQGSPILDFLSVVGIGDVLAPGEELPYENRRQKLGDTIHRYWYNRSGQSLHDLDLAKVTNPFHGAKVAWPIMGCALQARFVAAFGNSNLRLSQKYQLPALELIRHQRQAAVLPSLEAVFGIDTPATER